MIARKTRVIVKFEGADITAALENNLSSLSYTDNEEDAADDLQLSLEDREGKWLNDWLAQTGGKGIKIEAKIIQEEGNTKKVLPCGQFEIDNISSSGPPDKVSIKAISIPQGSKLASEEKTKAWEKVKLSAIAKEIAKQNKMEFIFDSKTDPNYDRREQSKKTDISFLCELCKDAGISLKITDRKIVLFDASKYEKMPPVAVFKRGYSDVLSYRFSTKLKDTGYSSCEVSYTDSKTKNTIKGSYERKQNSKNKKVLKINTKVSSKEEAIELAKKKLREKNKNETTASFDVVGNAYLVAGSTIKIEGWGLYDGKYIIQSAVHSVGNSGYTTSLSLRKVLEGY